MKTMDSEIKDEVFVDEYTGGLVGNNWGSITSSFATGAVSVGLGVGGLAHHRGVRGGPAAGGHHRLRGEHAGQVLRAGGGPNQDHVLAGTCPGR